MPDGPIAAEHHGVRATHPLRSIMMRIFAAFFLVLLLPAAMTGVVWQATRNVSRALRADAISQGANSHIDAVRAALAEALLRMAVYLRVEEWRSATRCRGRSSGCRP